MVSLILVQQPINNRNYRDAINLIELIGMLSDENFFIIVGNVEQVVGLVPTFWHGVSDLDVEVFIVAFGDKVNFGAVQFADVHTVPAP